MNECIMHVYMYIQYTCKYLFVRANQVIKNKNFKNQIILRRLEKSPLVGTRTHAEPTNRQ